MTERLTPMSWNELVRRLRNLGYNGPYRSGKHHFMVKGDFRLTIPNPPSLGYWGSFVKGDT